MKVIIGIIIAAMAAVASGYSQEVNWRSLGEERPNVVQFNTGYDFSATLELGYSRYFDVGKPLVVELDYSFPMGSDLLDDFKVRLGGQMELVQIDGFSATVKIYSVLRRYETELVRIVSFGSDFAAVAGYYRPSWYAAGEFGFDKSITSNLKHSDIMKAIYPAIRDGWYIPSGGHYYYGVQGGMSIGWSLDLLLRAGFTLAQDADVNATIPYYAQLGLGMKF